MGECPTGRHIELTSTAWDWRPSGGERKSSLAFMWLTKCVPITADCGTLEWECRPRLLPQSCGEGRLELSQHRSTRSTTMFRGFAIAPFGMSIFAQLDRTLFYGRNTDAALKLVRKIGRGFGL